MEKTKSSNLPVAGRIQHGEQISIGNEKTRVKEHGYFIAKIKEEQMQNYLQQKFDQLYKGKTNIEIEIFDEEPLTKKFVRYNQGGTVCQCMENSNTASQKTKNGFQEIQCDKINCLYRQKNEQGKMACNRIAWFKFLIPKVCTDRIWLMRITGQRSINRLNDYFEFRKQQGKSSKGKYTLFLKEEQQQNFQAKTFNHYILDIFENQDFNSNPSPIISNENLSTDKATPINKKEDTTPKVEETNQAVKMQEEKQAVNKENKTTKSRSTKKKTTKSNTTTENSEKSNTVDEIDYNQCYIFINAYNEKIKFKSGEEKDYLIGVFHNMSDDEFNVVINPKDSTKLAKCELGTIVKLDIKTVADKQFALNIEYVDEKLKSIAA